MVPSQEEQISAAIAEQHRMAEENLRERRQRVLAHISHLRTQNGMLLRELERMGSSARVNATKRLVKSSTDSMVELQSGIMSGKVIGNERH